MKKDHSVQKRDRKGDRQPFWMPWGAGGFLGRLILFLMLLFALLLLLSLFRSCKHEDASTKQNEDVVEVPDDILHPNDSVRIITVPVDTTSNLPHNIEHPSPNLPAPDRNILPPVNDDDIITDDDQRQIVDNLLNVILDDPNANDETFNRWADEFKQLYPGNDYSIVYYDRLTKMLKIKVPASQRENIMRNLPQQITDISFKIFPDAVMQHSAAKPNDPIFRYAQLSWYFSPIQAYEAWEITKGSPQITIAIVDSYFDLQHDDLNSNRIVKPYSIARRTGNVAPAEDSDQVSFMHGSMVASQALGTMNNHRGTTGIAPLCKFMPVSLGHRFTTMTILQGLLYAIYQGANVVNVSAGCMFGNGVHGLSDEEQIAISQQMGLEEQDVWEYVARLANDRNVTIVWAAGNEDIFAALDPSKRGDATIKVSAVDQRLKKADFSNYGNFPEKHIEESTVSAPGVNIFGAMPYNSYNIGPGTSFAAPIVTGTVALMKSLKPDITTRQIIDILKSTGKPVQGDNSIGNLIQIKDALVKVKELRS